MKRGRRCLSFIRAASYVIVLGGLIPGQALSQEVCLTHGPLVGGVSATEAIVWVRANRSAQVQVEYSRLSLFTPSFLSTVIETSPSQDLTGKVRLVGLLPEHSISIGSGLMGRLYLAKTALEPAPKCCGEPSHLPCSRTSAEDRPRSLPP